MWFEEKYNDVTNFYSITKDKLLDEDKKFIEEKLKEISENLNLKKETISTLENINDDTEKFVNNILDDPAKYKKAFDNLPKIKNFISNKEYDYYSYANKRYTEVNTLDNNFEKWYWDYALGHLRISGQSGKLGIFEEEIDKYRCKFLNILNIGATSASSLIVGNVPAFVDIIKDAVSNKFKEVAEYYGKHIKDLSSYQLYRVRMSILKILLTSGSYKTEFQYKDELKAIIIKRRVYLYKDYLNKDYLYKNN